MLKVYGCFVEAHDFRLVALAAAVCALASFGATSLLRHADKAQGNIRHLWLGVAGLASGFGIWATHFIAMLAFAPGVPSGYNVALTALSLLAAVCLTAAGLSLAVSARIPGCAYVGGAVVGGGIATMHYIGMAAFELAGHIVWDATLVVASVALGAALGGFAVHLALAGQTAKHKGLAAAALTLAICSHHFTAMGAAAIIPDPLISVSDAALPASLLAAGVALASFIILLLAFAALALDIRDQRRSALESDRMRGLANAAVEGLIVCDGEIIVTANESFAALTGFDTSNVAGAPLGTCIPDDGARSRIGRGLGLPVETELRAKTGALIPVEVIVRVIDFAGRPHRAIAVRDLRDRKKAEQHIQFLAHHDPLTGLPNRSSFNERLEREIEKARSSGQRLAVLCLDLDRFKEINDLFGHAAGDQLLRSVAKCVTGVLDQSQMMARLGGDEFAIILPGLSDSETAGRIAENVLEAIRAGNAGKGGVGVSSSIGIAICPDDAADRQALMNDADAALYTAKSEGRSTYRFFEQRMGVEIRDRRLLEHELRRAVSRGELNMVYQPQVLIETGETVGFEALLRWAHPDRGDVSPDLFIPIAEESGAIVEIGEWVLNTACAEAAAWTRPLSIAVNVSAVQLHRPNFAQFVHETLFQTGLAAHRLELEITETALVTDLDRALTALRQLKALGVRIAMDDFGTGYSSLSNLRAFPFDRIKIDRSFVKSVDRSEQAAAIVRAVIGLGRGLGLPVLAEGVESEAELAFLGAELCQEAQGYLLSRPSPIGRFRQITHPGLEEWLPEADVHHLITHVEAA